MNVLDRKLEVKSSCKVKKILKLVRHKINFAVPFSKIFNLNYINLKKIFILLK